MNIKKGEVLLSPYLSNPKMWRQYHPTVIKIYRDLGTETVGFNFWFPPAYDGPTKLATEKFIEGFGWSRENNFPVILGEAPNIQDPVIYKVSYERSISLGKDLVSKSHTSGKKAPPLNQEMGSWDLVHK